MIDLFELLSNNKKILFYNFFAFNLPFLRIRFLNRATKLNAQF
jgi:hypothetical protein